MGMKKHLFLKWCLVTVFTLALVSMALIRAKSQAVDLNPIAKTMVGVIALVYLIATVYRAKLCWQTDQALEDLEDGDTRAGSDRGSPLPTRPNWQGNAEGSPVQVARNNSFFL
jgi:hypothetical protein